MFEYFHRDGSDVSLKTAGSSVSPALAADGEPPFGCARAAAAGQNQKRSCAQVFTAQEFHHRERPVPLVPAKTLNAGNAVVREVPGHAGQEIAP
jgi:hypothetical protein